jgi:hypothetical protein
MYLSSNIKMVRSRRNRRPECVINPGLMGKMGNGCRILIGNLKTRNHLENLVVDGETILKLVAFEVITAVVMNSSDFLDVTYLLATWFRLISCLTCLLLRP